MKKYRVQLTEEEQQELKAMVSRGRAAAYRQTHARILLLSDEGQGGRSHEGRRDCPGPPDWLLDGGTGAPPLCGGGAGGGLGASAAAQPPPEETGRSGEAQLVALACAEPPEGRVSWTLQLLADRLVECEIVESISPETVRQTLKKTNSSPRSATGQALAEGVLVHPAPRQRRVRVRDGRRAGSLSAPVWGQRSAGVPGRDQQTTEPALGHDRG